MHEGVEASGVSGATRQAGIPLATASSSVVLSVCSNSVTEIALVVVLVMGIEVVVSAAAAKLSEFSGTLLVLLRDFFCSVDEAMAPTLMSSLSGTRDHRR